MVAGNSAGRVAVARETDRGNSRFGVSLVGQVVSSILTPSPSTEDNIHMTELEHKQYGVSFGVSLLGIPQYKFYTRNGKKFLRNYRRAVKDGLTVLDLQRILNKQMSERITHELATNVYS